MKMKKARNPRLTPKIINGLAELTGQGGISSNDAVKDTTAAKAWIKKVVDNERDYLAMQDPSGTFQIWHKKPDGAEKPVYGSELTQPLGKMYMRMQKLGMRVRVTRDGRDQVVGKSGGYFVIGDEIDFNV